MKEKQPVFLSDGVHMAYLSNETGEFQVFIKNLKTNEKRQITTLRHGVLRYQLSDDETKLVFDGNALARGDSGKYCIRRDDARKEGTVGRGS